MLNRNDPCWCGSGKKYKKCHMSADGSSAGGKARARMAKSPSEQDGMRRAGAFNGELMDYIRPFITAGTTTATIDRLIHDYTVERGHTPATLGYHGYPRSTCTSLNNTVCHGIPSSSEVLREGDIVNIDLTTIVDGFHGDSSETFMIGTVKPEARRLVEVTARALLRGIVAVGPGKLLKSIGEAIEPYVVAQGCSVVRQYTGHGIGRKFHENFTVYHHRDPECQEIVLGPGMTLTVEPMINLGGWEVVTDPIDKWTVRTSDGSLSAQFEHTIMITDNGVEILTLTPSQRLAGRILLVPGIDLPEASLSSRGGL